MAGSRRQFIKGAALGGAGTVAAASSLSAPAIAQERREWRMVTSWPAGLPGVGTGAERIASWITEATEGRITVQVFGAGELVPALQVWDAVSDGTAQLGHDASYYHIGKTEGAAFFTAFPFGFTADEITAWVDYGGGQALWDELYEPFNLKGFLAGNTGTQTFGWFREEINSVADLEGKRFRAPGNQGRVLSKLGVTVVVLPGGEIFPALQAGTIDGAEWIGPYNDLSFGLYQVCPYYYSPGYHEPGSALQLTVNKSEWDSLPSDLKAIVQAAAGRGNSDMLAEYNAQSGPALRTLVQEHGVQLRSLPEDILIACGNASNEVLNEVYEDADDVVRRIIESYAEFRRAIIPWTRIGEQAFLNSRLLPFEYELAR
ncbi:MAG: TRAP transporter substrate-binding protein [Azospirillaceae bacterium]